MTNVEFSCGWCPATIYVPETAIVRSPKDQDRFTQLKLSGGPHMGTFARCGSCAQFSYIGPVKITDGHLEFPETLNPCE